MSIERVKKALEQFGLAHQIRELEDSSATVELAALALGVETARIAKSLTFSSPEGCILVVCAGDGRVDNKKFKSQFGIKAKMLSGEEVEQATGYRIGGVCPFALREYPVQVYLDESLRRFETVFPACGSSNSAIELTMDQLSETSGAEGWVDVCKGWRGEGESENES